MLAFQCFKKSLLFLTKSGFLAQLIQPSSTNLGWQDSPNDVELRYNPTPVLISGMPRLGAASDPAPHSGSSELCLGLTQ